MVTERVEQPATRVAGRGHVVLALVEEEPRLLTVADIDLVLDAVELHGHVVGHLAVDHTDTRLESLELPHARIVAFDDTGGAGALDEQPGQQWQQRVGALRQRLHDQHVAVAIDHDRRQQVGLAVHETPGRAVDGERLAEPQRGIEAGAPKRLVHGTVVVGQHAQGDLRLIAEERVPQHAIAGAAYAHHGAPRHAVGGDVRPVDPRMPVAQTRFAARRDVDVGSGRGGHRSSDYSQRMVWRRGCTIDAW